MRTRSKFEYYDASSRWLEETLFQTDDPNDQDLTIKTVKNSSGLRPKVLDSVITDVVRLGPEVYVDPVTGRWRRVHHAKPSDRSTSPRRWARPVNRCDHVYTKITGLNTSNVIIQHSRRNISNDRTDIRTQTFADMTQMIAARCGVPLQDMLEWPTSGTSGSYLNHDWFALADQFREQCEQFTPSSFLGLEDVAQGGIFIDALKTVINPTRSVQFLLKWGKRLGRNARRMNLGRFAHEVAKQSANAGLTYAFGIRPAVSDILSSLNAHKRVSERMRILRSSAGKFIPIRVSQELNSEYENDSLSPSSEASSDDFRWVTSSKKSTAHIGAWGRVREDLTFSDDWSAYLQYFGINKMVGLAWELIPYSFVADWFTNAQERINSLTRLRTGGPFAEITNISSSIKQVHTEDLYLIPGYDHSFGGYMKVPNSAQKLISRDTVSYSRFPYIPDTSGVVDFSTLGLFHAITGAGLIIKLT